MNTDKRLQLTSNPSEAKTKIHICCLKIASISKLYMEMLFYEPLKKLTCSHWLVIYTEVEIEVWCKSAPMMFQCKVYVKHLILLYEFSCSRDCCHVSHVLIQRFDPLQLVVLVWSSNVSPNHYTVTTMFDLSLPSTGCIIHITCELSSSSLPTGRV